MACATPCRICQRLGVQKKPLFWCIEYDSHFAVRHNPTGEESPMGDGVDTLFREDGRALIPGTVGFIDEWERVLNSNASETFEAYFSHLPSRLLAN